MYVETDKDGVKHIYLEADDDQGRKETEDKWIGKWIDETAYDYIAESDCNVYAPPQGIFGDCEPIVIFRKGVFDRGLTRPAYEGLIKGATASNNRGVAGGPVEEHKLAGNLKIAENLGFRAKVFTKDGRVSDTLYANQVNSGIGGSFDKYARTPYCRTTAFSAHNREKFEAGIPLIKALSDKFEKFLPTRYNHQKSWVNDTDKAWIIRDTVYSTITINKNFRTACHYDAGDLHEGFGNLVVLENGDYSGAFTVFPRYRVGVNCREGDLLLMDVHEAHGNTEMVKNTDDATRVSVVCYYRAKMHNCGTKEHENRLKEEFMKKLNPDQTHKHFDLLEQVDGMESHDGKGRDNV